ncbi:hypothetical protein FVE85_9444 [Porphyridium purpureum]|uniref:Reverse transcriptase Ty1/copia-type domain-containing protein n=1 Tax=Porphyridium purpureum TaxID=35688 RepID=A0A5J4YID9_PORPP|nr:hypothetical protein FVE85_9444 [Porphyridium purpureum]|eukprot:POR7859..scf261_15
MKKAIYGLPSSGTDVLREAAKRLCERGWRETAPSVFWRSEYMLVAYVDDYLIVGPTAKIERVKIEMHETFTLNNTSERLTQQKAISSLGIKFGWEQTHTCVDYTAYAEYLICFRLESVNRTGPGSVHVPRSPDTKIEPSELETIFISGHERAQIGTLLWMTRTDRRDLVGAVVRVARCIDRSSVGVKTLFEKTLKYLKAHARSIICYRMPEDPKGPRAIQILIFVDSDLAGDEGARVKSRTGVSAFFEVQGQRYILNWASQERKVVATSLANADIVALYTHVKVLSHLKPYAVSRERQ